MSRSAGYACDRPKRLTVRLSIGSVSPETSMVLGYGQAGPEIPEHGIVMNPVFSNVWALAAEANPKPIATCNINTILTFFPLSLLECVILSVIHPILPRRNSHA